MAYDPLKLTSGLLDDADLIVRDAIFRNDPEYNNGQTYFLELTWLEEGEDETTERFGCGKGWETNDGGLTAEREDGREINFHKNSKIGELFGGLVEVIGKDAKAKQAIVERLKQYPLGPRDAGFWKGLMFHVHREERKSRDAEIGDWEVLVIDAFNGIEGDKAPAKAAAPAKKAAKKAAPKAAEPAADDTPALDPAIVEQLDVIADESADHDSFMERAIAEIPEVSANADLKAAVMDNEAEDGIWKRAVARYEALAAQS